MTSHNHQQFCSSSVEDTMVIAMKLARSLAPPRVIAVSGALGAGKTQFVRGLATGLGIDPRAVSSPTFTLCQEYTGPTTLVHIDAYRITGDDLESIGWDELLEQQDVVIAVEWPEHLGGRIPLDSIRVEIRATGEDERRIRIDLVAADETGACPRRPATDTCRVCGRPVDRGLNKAGTFCSERCRLVDLGRWFSGSYSISRDLEEEDIWEG